MPSKVPFGGTLTGLLDFWAMRTGSATAIAWDQGEVSYASLAAESRRIASALAGVDIRPGDTVAIWMANCPAWMAVFFGCARLGVRVAAINTRFTMDEVQGILERSRAKALFCWPLMMGLNAGAVLESMDRSALVRLSQVVAYGEASSGKVLYPFTLHTYEEVLSAQPAHWSFAAPDAGAVLFTTSGSTGKPKLVLHNQGGLTTHAADVARAAGLEAPGTVALQPMPLCGGYGLCQMLAGIAAGKRVVIQSRWDIEQMAHLIVENQVTNFCGTDELIMRLLSTSTVDRPFPSVRWCGYATFSAGLGDWFEAAEARGLRPVGLYGASEVQALYAIQNRDAPIDLRCRNGGFPVSAQAQVRVGASESDADSTGEVGELEMSGPSRMVGYDGDAAATERAIMSDGFVRIGDYGRLLDDGSFLFEGRSGDWLRVSGFLVAPAEIESVIESVPGIEGCRVVGTDWKGAQRPFAFVTLGTGAQLNEQAILAICADRLSRYKVPVRVEAIEAFPVTDGPNGTKIQKHVLQKMAADLIAG